MTEFTQLSDAEPQVSVIWDCDFNDVDQHGCVLAEPTGGLFPRVQEGDTILLTDGMHLCDALVTGLRDEYVTARPFRHTWQEPANPYFIGPQTVPYGWFLNTGSGNVIGTASTEMTAPPSQAVYRLAIA